MSGIASKYVVQGEKVQWHIAFAGREIFADTELDAATFQDLGDGYAKDAARVVHSGDVIDADVVSFVVLGHGYAKDAQTVFASGAPATEPDSGPWDPPTFRVFGPRYVADARGVCCIRYGYDCYEVIEVEGSDADDFEEVGLVFGRAPRAGVIFDDGVARDDLDAASFALRGRWFASDVHGVYHLAYGGKHTDSVGLTKIDADPLTFVVVGDHYAHDAERVFYNLNDDGDADLAVVRELTRISPRGFAVIEAIDGYARAGDVVLNHGEPELAIGDPTSFAALAPGFARDRTHVYRMTPELRAMDGYSLHVLVPSVVEGADPATFEVQPVTD